MYCIVKLTGLDIDERVVIMAVWIVRCEFKSPRHGLLRLVALPCHLLGPRQRKNGVNIVGSIATRLVASSSVRWNANFDSSLSTGKMQGIGEIQPGDRVERTELDRLAISVTELSNSPREGLINRC